MFTVWKVRAAEALARWMCDYGNTKVLRRRSSDVSITMSERCKYNRSMRVIVHLELSICQWHECPRLH